MSAKKSCQGVSPPGWHQHLREELAKRERDQAHAEGDARAQREGRRGGGGPRRRLLRAAEGAPPSPCRQDIGQDNEHLGIIAARWTLTSRRTCLVGQTTALARYSEQD